MSGVQFGFLGAAFVVLVIVREIVRGIAKPSDRYTSVEPQNPATRSNGRLAAHSSIVRPLTERQ